MRGCLDRVNCEGNGPRCARFKKGFKRRYSKRIWSFFYFYSKIIIRMGTRGMKDALFRKTKENSNSSIKFKFIIITINLVVLLFIVFLLQQTCAYLYTSLQEEKTYSLKVKSMSLKLNESSTNEVLLIVAK